MAVFKRAFGRIQWTPPEWLDQFGKRRFGLTLLAVVATAVVFAAGVYYVQSLPKPPLVSVQVVAPGISNIAGDEVRPMPLTLNFTVKTDPRAPVQVVESLARLDLVNEVVNEGIRMTPELAGEWRWVTERRLMFYPEEDWPAGQDYLVTFDASLFGPNLEFDTHEAQFQTPAFDATVAELSFYQDPVQRNLRKVVATLRFSHPVDPDSLADHLTYTQRESGATVDTDADTVEYTVQFDAVGRTAYIHSVPIEIPPVENYMTLHLRDGLAPREGPSRLEEERVENVLIPDIGTYFRVNNAQVLIARDEDDNPLQTLTLAFTDRVQADRLQQRIQVTVLPEERSNGQPYGYWSSPREVDAAALRDGDTLDLQLSPVQGDAAALHSAVIDVPEHRTLYVKVEEGLESEGEFILSRAFDTVVRVPAYPKEAKIAQEGSVLPLTGSHQLTMVSRGVSTLRVELGRLLDDEVNHLATQTGGDISQPYFSNYRFNQDNITERAVRYIDVNAGHPSEASYSSLDLSEYLASGGYFFVNVQGWDRERDRPIGGQDRRFVLISDLGLLVKTNADATQDVFVHSIETGQPVSGARVLLLGKNGVPVFERTTAADGHTTFPSTADFEREKTPSVFVVRNGNDSIFMPFARHGRMLQYSRFDVGGQYLQRGAQDQRLRAQVFSDRGIYRPGDSVNLAAIVKREDWGSLGNLPLLLRIIDGRGQVAHEKKFVLPDDGFVDQAFETDATSATGNYTATLFLIDEGNYWRTLGSTGFKVQEFLPDRLRIRTRIQAQKTTGWMKPGDLAAEVDLENLFGTPAQARRVTGELTLQPSRITIDTFDDFLFRDPLIDENTALQVVTETLAETRTNEAGRATLPLDLARYDSGIYRLIVNTEGFEEGGGRSVKSRASVMMSPLDYMVGYKTDGDLSFVNKDAARSVRFVAVDSDGASMPLNALTLSVLEYRYVSTLVERPNGTFAYQSVRKETPVSTRDFSIADGGVDFELPTDTPGDFAIALRDDDGRVFSQVDYTVAGARNLAGNLERDAELSLNVNGDRFSPGDEIQIEITAPYTGTGLITIERDRVYAYQWIQSDTPTSVHTIRVPDDLEGNAYINVAFVRELDSPEIYVSPLSYAVAPFSVNRDARTIDIDLDTPQLARPGDTLEVSHTASEASRIVVYAVDEGILQVANYQLPNPLDHFLPKMALQVSTYQMVDLILPDFDQYRQRAAPGGGDGFALLGSNLNPFRRKTDAPMVYWSGIIESGPEARTLSFEIPDTFNGQLRVMAVAVSNSAVGSEDTSLVVRAPFVISPNVLTAAAPGDEFEVNVGLSNNIEGSGDDVPITLTATSSSHLELIGEPQTSLRIGEGNEGRALFRFRATESLGAANIRFTASGADESTTTRATLSVRPSVAYLATMQSGFDNDDPLELTFERTLYDEYAQQSVAASASPLILADGMLDYLEAFPHGCAEQMVSKVFPQLGFFGTADRSVDRAAIRDQFETTVARLRSRQRSDGAFRFWATSTEPARFPSVYILHFFTDADDLGLTVPNDMLDSGLGYLRQLAAEQVDTLPDARLRAYAIYVLTRNGLVTTNYLTNLHESLDRQFDDEWRTDLVASYMAATYALLQQDRLGDDLIAEFAYGAGDEMTTDFDTRLGRDAQHLYLVARHFPTKLSEADSGAIENLTRPIFENRYNTLSSAYTILALNAYTRAVFAADNTQLSISTEADGTVVPASPFARADLDNAVRELAIHGANNNAFFYVLSQTGFDQTPPTTALAEGLEIQRDYLDSDGNVVTSATIGDELTVRLRIRSTGQPRSNVAVVDLLPGGFEVNAEHVQRQQGGWSADYIDVREDRVVVYGWFPNRMTEVTYRVKLTAAGSFVVPAAFADSMYDRRVQARTKPGRFDVRPVASVQ